MKLIRKLAVPIVLMTGFLYLMSSIDLIVAQDFQSVDDNQPAVLDPIERIFYSNEWKHETQRTIKLGGHAFVILRTGMDTCMPIISQASETKLFAMHPTTIDTPSSKGGDTGVFYEALIPRNDKSCQISRYVFAEWKPSTTSKQIFRVGEQEIIVNVHIEGEFTSPKRMLSIALTNSYLIQGHCKNYCKREGELAHKYANLLVDHHIQPIQNWVLFPPVKNGLLDIDHGSEHGVSFKQTTLKYATSGHVGFPRMTHYSDRVGYLRALEATVQKLGLSGKAWVYAVDEPKLTPKLIEELKLYKILAPSVEVMVTTDFDSKLSQVVDIFAPVYNNLVSNDKPSKPSYSEKKLWSYASCMGSCGPNRKSSLNVKRAPGPNTNLPDFLIDRPVTKLFEFFKTLDDLNANGALYYEATEGYPLYRMGIDLIKDQWNFGGNGDGLLTYPGRPGEYGLTEHHPLQSLRLKFIRHAIENYW